MRAMAGREEIGRTGFAGKEQAIGQGESEIGPAVGMARQRDRIAAAGMGIEIPGGSLGGRKVAADAATQGMDQVILGRLHQGSGFLQLAGVAAAEIAAYDV